MYIVPSSALNSGQVGGTRAAQYIAARYTTEPMKLNDFCAAVMESVLRKINLGEKLIQKCSKNSNVRELRERIGKRTSKAGAAIRSLKDIEEAPRDSEILKNCRKNCVCLQYMNFPMPIRIGIY